MLKININFAAAKNTLTFVLKSNYATSDRCLSC